ncbi:hypothetical protein T4D_7369 [Trichinella pseudospiralis]|uniref:Uncharacterized protein n=1 Tax=Trichinella pseudospiralis TaxID=6337 RepID=A0A0V1FBQ5_TRIPS|nr:hypothetical protein T4D_7369 [Trichinella pseudospiralis]
MALCELLENCNSVIFCISLKQMNIIDEFSTKMQVFSHLCTCIVNLSVLNFILPRDIANFNGVCGTISIHDVLLLNKQHGILLGCQLLLWKGSSFTQSNRHVSKNLHLHFLSLLKFQISISSHFNMT